MEQKVQCFSLEELRTFSRLVQKGEGLKQFVRAGNENQYDFPQITWQPEAEDSKDVVQLMKDKMTEIAPNLDQFVETDEDGPMYDRFFVWRLRADAPTDKSRDKSFCWHLDGDRQSRQVIAAIAIIHSPSTHMFPGTMVHVSTRSDENEPTPEETITFHTPHNSMYSISGGSMLHSVSHDVPVGVTRYAFVAFMRGRARVHGHNLRAYLAKQWQSRVKIARGQI